MNSEFKKHLSQVAVAIAVVIFSTSALAAPEGMVVEDFIDGLQFPVSLAPASNGDILVAEKFGTVRLVRDGVLLDQPIASFDVTTQNEAGLIGITPLPDYEDSGEFLAVYTPEDPLDKIFVSHMQVDGDRARVLDERFIELPSRPSTDRHYAGNVRFGPDGMLFISIGELRQADWAQDNTSLPGSMLRYNADGTVPDDNPFGADNAVFAYGLRNPFDFDFDADGRLYASENGGDVNDEINLIELGNNYGWPIVRGYCDNFPLHEPCENVDAFTPPAFEFRTINGPTGLMVYDGEMFPDMQGDVFLCGWHSGVIHRLVPQEGAPDKLEHLDPVYRVTGDLGITDVEQANDGALLVLLAGREGGEIKRIVADGEASGEQQADEEEAEGGCTAAGGRAPIGLGWLLIALLVPIARKGADELR